MIKAISVIMLFLVLTITIYIRQEAQVGIFTGRDTVTVPSGAWWTDVGIGRIEFTDPKTKQKVKMPWSSILYAVEN